MDAQVFYLAHDIARTRATQAIQAAPDGYRVTIKPPARNLDQNAKFWAMLDDVSKQVCWHGRYLSSEQWKHVFSASLRKQDAVPNLDNDGFVVMGVSTRTLTKRQMADLIELIYAFGVQRGVKFNG